MEAFVPDTAEAILLGLLALAFGLAWLARARPEVAWLQVFRFQAFQLSEEQKRRQRRSADRLVAVKLILAGLALPLLYVVYTVMMFSDVKPLPAIIVTVCSVACVAVGIWILVRG